MTLILSSSAFSHGEEIPGVYSCEGMDVSPPLEWSGAPDETKSLALFCNDPDAPGGTWHHWALFDVPAGLDHLEPGLATTAAVGRMRQGLNDFKRHGYGGPCPPPGHGVHHYHFVLLALEVEKLQVAGDTCPEIESAARQYALAEAELVGTYER